VSRVDIGASGYHQLAFTPDGSRIAVSADFKIVLIDVPEARGREELQLRLKGVYGLGFSSDRRHLANAAADGRLRVWERAE